jgi:2-polyprenyl-6-methoxyphenol hydroxylase-like FAD-dependent oxidoreductase
MTPAVTTTIPTDVCVAGGGPAGLMAPHAAGSAGYPGGAGGKHADVLRDFRGDTVHPSTLDLLDELGLGQELLELPHRDVVERLTVTFADGTFTLADFSRLRIAHPYIRFMPQWHLLNLLAEAAEQSPTFTLLRSHEVTDVVRDRGVVTGVRAVGPDGEVQVRAYLTIAADGRASAIRERLALPLRTFGALMDVLWFRLFRRPSDGDGLEMRVGPGRLMLAVDRRRGACHVTDRRGGHQPGSAGRRRDRADVGPKHHLSHAQHPGRGESPAPCTQRSIGGQHPFQEEPLDHQLHGLCSYRGNDRLRRARNPSDCGGSASLRPPDFVGRTGSASW